jgi:hypothetical protein
MFCSSEKLPNEISLRAIMDRGSPADASWEIEKGETIMMLYMVLALLILVVCESNILVTGTMYCAPAAAMRLTQLSALKLVAVKLEIKSSYVKF